MTTRNLLSVGRVVLAVALLGVAVALWKNMPTKLDTWAPIAVEASIGQRAVGRDLAVTVHRVEVARAVEFDQGGQLRRVPATAAWLVFALSYEPLHDFDNSPQLRLVTSGRTYESNIGSLGQGPHPVGVEKRGVAAFELPEVPSEAVLQVANTTREKWGNELNAPLDSQISLRVDVGALPLQDAVNLDDLEAG